MSGPDEPGGVDIADISPLSSQAVGHWGSPLATTGTTDAILEEEILPVSRRRFRVFSSLFRRPKFLAGFCLFAVTALMAIFAPLIQRFPPNTLDFGALNGNPSATHWLGTDYLGRDLWSRLAWGGRISLTEGILIVALSFSIGVPWGITAGFGNRAVDDLLMRAVDIMLAIPGLILAFSIIAILGTGVTSVVVALGIAGIPGYARVARASTLSTKSLDYVLSARSQGAGAIHVMRRHVLPNIVDPLVILATLNLSAAILAAAALSFLGIGTQPPQADWGTMLAKGYNYMFESDAQVLYPALIIIMCVLGINLMGDSIGEALNPRMGRR
jgi:peptide/nickel transport system permease protein